MYEIFGTDTSDTEPDEAVAETSQGRKKARAKDTEKVKPPVIVTTENAVSLITLIKLIFYVGRE